MGKKANAHKGMRDYNDTTEYGTENLTPGEAKKTCAHCRRKFIINLYNPGRVRTYCSPSCRNRAYLKRKGVDNPHRLIVENQAQEQGLNGLKMDTEAKITKAQKETQKRQETALNGVKSSLDRQIQQLNVEVAKLRKDLAEAQKKNLSEWLVEGGMQIVTTALGVKLKEWLTAEENRPLTRGEFRAKIQELIDEELPSPNQLIETVKIAIDEDKHPWKERERKKPHQLRDPQKKTRFIPKKTGFL